MIDIVGNNIIVLTGNVRRAAVGQVSAICEAHAHHGITGLQQCQLNCHVCLSAGVGLYVGELSAEQVLGSLNTKALQLVHKLTAAIVTLSGETFCI